MKNTIKDLWYGNIDPMERCGVGDSEINELIRLMEKNSIRLSEGLSEKQAEIFQKYIDCSDEYAFSSATHAFIAGFSLACKLMAEAFVA